jgi:hypothetical protein
MASIRVGHPDLSLWSWSCLDLCLRFLMVMAHLSQCGYAVLAGHAPSRHSHNSGWRVISHFNGDWGSALWAFGFNEHVFLSGELARLASLKSGTLEICIRITGSGMTPDQRWFAAVKRFLTAQYRRACGGGLRVHRREMRWGLSSRHSMSRVSLLNPAALSRGAGREHLNCLASCSVTCSDRMLADSHRITGCGLSIT